MLTETLLLVLLDRGCNSAEEHEALCTLLLLRHHHCLSPGHQDCHWRRRGEEERLWFSVIHRNPHNWSSRHLPDAELGARSGAFSIYVFIFVLSCVLLLWCYSVLAVSSIAGFYWLDSRHGCSFLFLPPPGYFPCTKNILSADFGSIQDMFSLKLRLVL